MHSKTKLKPEKIKTSGDTKGKPSKHCRSREDLISKLTD